MKNLVENKTFNKYATSMVEAIYTGTVIVQEKCVKAQMKLNKELDIKTAKDVLEFRAEYNRWRYLGKENQTLDEMAEHKLKAKAEEIKAKRAQQQK